MWPTITFQGCSNTPTRWNYGEKHWCFPSFHPRNHECPTSPKPHKWKCPTIKQYDGSSKLETQGNLLSDNLTIHCKLYPTTRKVMTLQWYYSMSINLIDSFWTFCVRFSAWFIDSKHRDHKLDLPPQCRTRGNQTTQAIHCSFSKSVSTFLTST